MQRIGVFVCWCGSNIAATVDVEAVKNALALQPGVVYATDYQYMCSASGQNLIKDAIKDYQLTGVVICSCSPRMHETTFRKTVQQAGLNPYMLEIANIREQDSWIHKDRQQATEKAIILGRSAIAYADRLRALFPARGCPLAFASPTNQVFVTLENSLLRRISESVETCFWEAPDPDHTTVRFATGWATREEDIAAVERLFD